MSFPIASEECPALLKLAFGERPGGVVGVAFDMGSERIERDRCRLLILQALIEEMQRAVRGAGGLCPRAGALTRVGFSIRPQLARGCRMLHRRSGNLPRHARAGGHPVFWAAVFAAFLDSRFRGNDESLRHSAKNLPLKGAGAGWADLDCSADGNGSDIVGGF